MVLTTTACVEWMWTFDWHFDDDGREKKKFRWFVTLACTFTYQIFLPVLSVRVSRSDQFLQVST